MQSESGNPKQPQLIFETYWEIHVNLIKLLALAGILKPPLHRLDPFRIKYELAKLIGVNPDLVSDICGCLDRLVILRRMGQEPKHDGTKYL